MDISWSFSYLSSHIIMFFVLFISPSSYIPYILFLSLYLFCFPFFLFSISSSISFFFIISFPPLPFLPSLFLFLFPFSPHILLSSSETFLFLFLYIMPYFFFFSQSIFLSPELDQCDLGTSCVRFLSPSVNPFLFQNELKVLKNYVWYTGLQSELYVYINQYV